MAEEMIKNLPDQRFMFPDILQPADGVSYFRNACFPFAFILTCAQRPGDIVFQPFCPGVCQAQDASVVPETVVVGIKITFKERFLQIRLQCAGRNTGPLKGKLQHM